MDCPRQGRVHARANIEVGPGQCHSLMVTVLPGPGRQGRKSSGTSGLALSRAWPYFRRETGDPMQRLTDKTSRKAAAMPAVLKRLPEGKLRLVLRRP